FLFYTINLAIFLTLLFFLRSFDDKKQDAIFVQRVYPIIESIILCFYYYLLIRLKHKTIIISVALLILCSTFIPEFFNDSLKPSFLPMALKGIFFILLILYFFLKKLIILVIRQFILLPAFGFQLHSF